MAMLRGQTAPEWVQYVWYHIRQYWLQIDQDCDRCCWYLLWQQSNNLYTCIMLYCLVAVCQQCVFRCGV